jgi:hypothetical protein
MLKQLIGREEMQVRILPSIQFPVLVVRGLYAFATNERQDREPLPNKRMVVSGIKSGQLASELENYLMRQTPQYKLSPLD